MTSIEALLAIYHALPYDAYIRRLLMHSLLIMVHESFLVDELQASSSTSMAEALASLHLLYL